MPRRWLGNIAAGLRVVVDASNEKISYKVREHSLAKVPVLLVVGRRKRRPIRCRPRQQQAESLALGKLLD